MSDVDVRASDDERQAVIDRLAADFRAGRLDADELEDRTAKANAALTRGELVALEADLPAAAPTGPEPDLVARARHRRERVVSAASLCVFLWVIWLATGADGFAWPIFPTAVIGLGVVRVLWGGADPDDLPSPRLPKPPGPPRRP